jgi:signal transduction histidine kinase
MVTVIGAVAIAFYVVTLSAESIFLDRERNDALAEHMILREAFNEEGVPGLVRRIQRRARLGSPEAHYALFDQAGRTISGDLLERPPALAPDTWGVVQSRTRKGPVTLHAATTRLSGGYLLVVGRDDAGKRDFEARIATGLMIALGIVAAASLGVGLLLNALVIQRANSVAALAERIAGGDMGARADGSQHGDAFDRIGSSLNSMLDRIDELITGMRTVTDSLAHDLRTPLARARGVAERALAREAGVEDCHAALRQVDRELAHVLAVFAALIDIVRAETGLSREMMRPLRLDEVVLDVAGLFAPVVEDGGQALVVAPMAPLTVDGHEQLLRQAIGNLLINAVRHAGAGATVTMDAVARDGMAELIVADTGPGIPPEDCERVKHRFVKLDDARTGGGSGLGLAIASAAAKLHGGELRLEDNAPGLRAVLSVRRDEPGLNEREIERFPAIIVPHFFLPLLSAGSA